MPELCREGRKLSEEVAEARHERQSLAGFVERLLPAEGEPFQLFQRTQGAVGQLFPLAVEIQKVLGLGHFSGSRSAVLDAVALLGDQVRGQVNLLLEIRLRGLRQVRQMI